MLWQPGAMLPNCGDIYFCVSCILFIAHVPDEIILNRVKKIVTGQSMLLLQNIDYNIKLDFLNAWSMKPVWLYAVANHPGSGKSLTLFAYFIHLCPAAILWKLFAKACWLHPMYSYNRWLDSHYKEQFWQSFSLTRKHTEKSSFDDGIEVTLLD